MDAVERAAQKLLVEILKVKKDEVVCVTCDFEGDLDFALKICETAHKISAKPLLLYSSSPPHVGRAGEHYLPKDALKSALLECDVWIELNQKWLLYSSVYEEVVKSNKVRYICLVGMNKDMAVRCIGRLNVPLLLEFQVKLQELTKSARSMRYTTPAGTDVKFENDPKRPVLVEGDVNGPGEYMLIGQVDWAPVEESIEGVIVFDGSVTPPYELGLLHSPIKLKIKNGRVQEISGGQEAKVYQNWLKSFNDPNMFLLAHVSYGCNPGARLSGNVLEDERVWGCLEWGLGNQSDTFKAKGIKASSHSDGVTLKPTLYADSEIVIQNGEYVHEELVELANTIKKEWERA